MTCILFCILFYIFSCFSLRVGIFFLTIMVYLIAVFNVEDGLIISLSLITGHEEARVQHTLGCVVVIWMIVVFPVT